MRCWQLLINNKVIFIDNIHPENKWINLKEKEKVLKVFEFYNYNSPMLVINIMSSFGQLDKKITNLERWNSLFHLHIDWKIFLKELSVNNYHHSCNSCITAIL